MRLHYLILLVVLSSGCIDGESFDRGLDSLRGTDDVRERVEAGLGCVTASVEILSMEWTGSAVSVAVENTGSRDLEGFTITVETASSRVTNTDTTTVPAGGTHTFVVDTTERPVEVSVASNECVLASDRMRITA